MNQGSDSGTVSASSSGRRAGPATVSTVRLGVIELETADLGPDNPLAPLGEVVTDAHDGIETQGMDPEMASNVRYGRLSTVLPYRLQDGYSRDRHLRRLTVAVLENDQLRAEFLLDYGGRLFSLLHKPTGRELLHRNEMLQPANLGLRNAWFAGGVEWNIGATGHSPLTCSPIHAARVADAGGGAGLRLYAWERIRGVVYAIDCRLSSVAPVLIAHVTITNPNAHTVPMYWWSNIAVPETEGLRVLAPATTAYRYGYRSGLATVNIPIPEEVDVTYPAHADRSVDYFFDTRSAERPWIAALDPEGAGLIHTSTRELSGRKLFCWGRGRGGDRWQSFLSGPGQRYCEIQAGLARTQLERVPMPGNARWRWTEAYGLVHTDSARTHGSDWADARAAADEALEMLLPAGRMAEEHQLAVAHSARTPIEILHRGDGWGALERHLRAHTGAPRLDDTATPFGDETLGPDQEAWLTLLRTGVLPEQESPSYVIGPEWRRLLEAAPDSPNTWLHRGVTAWHAGDRAAARSAWRHAPDSPHALRNLAVTDADPATRAELLLTARRGAAETTALTVETVRALIDNDRPERALAVLDDCPVATGRMHVLQIEAALAAGRLDRAGSALARPVDVPDLREGELTLEALWFRYQEALAERAGQPLRTDEDRRRLRREHPVPAHLDFRMS